MRHKQDYCGVTAQSLVYVCLRVCLRRRMTLSVLEVCMYEGAQSIHQKEQIYTKAMETLSTELSTEMLH